MLFCYNQNVDKKNIVEEVYKPIFKEIDQQGLFKSEKQKEKWWNSVESSLDHSIREIIGAEKSNVVMGVEILADSCCEECNKHNGKIFKNGDSMPMIPFTHCSELKKGKHCNCCLLKVID